MKSSGSRFRFPLRCWAPAPLVPVHAQDAKIPQPRPSTPTLKAKLPKEIMTTGELIAVNSGSFPPYEIVSDTRTHEAAQAPISAHAIGEMLGVKMSTNR